MLLVVVNIGCIRTELPSIITLIPKISVSSSPDLWISAAG